MNLLERLAIEYDEKRNAIKDVLSNNKGKATQWIKNDRCFYILSKCAKKEGYQLTFFIDNEPISDKIRSQYLDRDFVEELAINECFLYKSV